MDINEMRIEIAETITEEVGRGGAGEVDQSDIERRIHEFADGHRAVIYSDWELFQFADVQCFEEEAIQLMSPESIRVSAVVSATIYLFIVSEAKRYVNEFEQDLSN